MPKSDSDARIDGPGTVKDPLEDSYEQMIARQRARNAAQEEEQSRKFEHPGALESMVPIWGSGKEALADFEDKNHVGGVVNTALAASDVFLAKAIVGGLLKGGLKVAGPHVWRTTLPERKVAEKRGKKIQGAREWLGEKGFLRPGQPGHHWFIEQKTKWVPDVVKNQPLFIKGMRDAVEHGRIHGPYTVKGVRLPQFNAAQRLWYGTPQWLKAAYVSSAGHSGAAAGWAADTKPKKK